MTPEHMLLSDMTAKGNLHLHPAAEGGSHGEMQALLPLSLVGAQKHNAPSRPKGISGCLHSRGSSGLFRAIWFCP